MMGSWPHVPSHHASLAMLLWCKVDEFHKNIITFIANFKQACNISKNVRYYKASLKRWEIKYRHLERKVKPNKYCLL